MVRQEDRKIIDMIDIGGLAGMGVYVILSSFFASNFAETHIQFSFLNFPVFMGEILLMLLFALYFYKQYLLREWHTWHIAWGIFITWMVGTAILEYLHWGPLALRNAALFYYPCFTK